MRSQKGILIILIHADLLDYLRWSKCWVGSSATNRRLDWYTTPLPRPRWTEKCTGCLQMSKLIIGKSQFAAELIWFNLPILLVFIIVYLYISMCIYICDYVCVWFVYVHPFTDDPLVVVVHTFAVLCPARWPFYRANVVTRGWFP